MRPELLTGTGSTCKGLLSTHPISELLLTFYLCTIVSPPLFISSLLLDQISLTSCGGLGWKRMHINKVDGAGSRFND